MEDARQDFVLVVEGLAAMIVPDVLGDVVFSAGQTRL
jgi:hypothetical protein